MMPARITVSARGSARIGVCLAWVVLRTAGAAAQMPAPVDVASVPRTADDRTASNASPLGIGDVLRRAGHDQKSIWGFPLKAIRGAHVKATLPFAATTIALVVLDSHDTPYFRRTSRFDTFNRDLSGLKTGLGEGLLPVAVFLIARARQDSYAMDSAWLAGEALLDADVVAEASKQITRRLRPSDISPTGDFGRTWFRFGDGVLSDHVSFPSGHAAGAFALAAVFGARYRDHRWVPWVAYGLATLVGFSRITLQSHFPSDVFAGGVLGGVIGHIVGARRLEQTGP
jgi:membrane-associated phospholipid phosphatase